jgi:hypothetical protein
MEWEDLKETIVKAASEVSGKRYKTTWKKGLKMWNDEISLIIDNTNQAYLKYLNTVVSEEDKLEYNRICTIAKR